MGAEKVYEAVLTVPYGKPWVPSHMILVRQRFADGSIKKYKARLVAGGHRQKFTSYEQTSSPTARPASIKILFAMAAIQKKIIRTFDVKGAYLKSNIDKEIYMMLPATTKGEKPNYVRLKKSIYGLKQAGLLWYQNIKSKLIKFGAIQCPYDECVFRYEDENEIIEIIIYVDDILTASTTIEIGNKLIKFLRDEYGEVNEVTDTSTHLGIQWKILKNNSIKINQPGYIKKLLKELHMEDSSPVNSPIITSYITKINDNEKMINEPIYNDELEAKATGGDENFYDNQHRMRQIIGLLNHIAIHTRPDILFAVSNLATKIMDANEYYIEQAMHIVRYLKGTINLGLVFSSEVKMELVANVDASFLTHDDSKSHSGICYSLGEGNTACFFSRSAKQKLVTRSSAEAELYALDLSIIDIQWFRAMLKFFGNTQLRPTKINEDNQSAMALAEGSTKSKDTSRHIKMRYHYCKEAIQNNEIYLNYVPSGMQVADILTKHISCQRQFVKLRTSLLNCTND